MPKKIWKFLSGIGKRTEELTGENAEKFRTERMQGRPKRAFRVYSEKQTEKQLDKQAETHPKTHPGGKQRKRLRNRMPAVAGLLAVLVLGCLAFTGCQGGNEENVKLEDLEFTVVGEKDTPPALQEMIGKKKTDPFKLTYADGQDMYIVIGEGPQDGGGFSIVVKELYLTENSVVIKTELMGPEKGEATGTEPSYPVLIVKTVFCEEPVVFQ